MLTVHQISKSFGIQPILKNISFSVSLGERVALIGPNGCGKTTLMRILTGQEPPDRGAVTFTQPGLRVGYLAQGLTCDPALTLGQVIHNCTTGLQSPETELARLATELAARPNDPQLQTAYDAVLQRVEWSPSATPPEQILASLGLSAIPQDQPVSMLSGGQKTRLALACVLLEEPHLLLLDEPTNHLDIAMLEWLEDWLAHFAGAALIVSHDRAFLDHTVSSVLELDPATQMMKTYAGNYSAYMEQKLAEQERQWQTYNDQQAEIRRMQQDIVRVKAQAAHTERMASSISIGGGEYKAKGFKSYQQGIAKKVAKKAKSREKKLERFLESDERVERPHQNWQMKLEFGRVAHRSHDILRLENLSVGYPGQAPLLADVNLAVHSGARLALIGPNGCGKTTLLRTIAGTLAPLGGQTYLGASVRLGYMTQEQEDLPPTQDVFSTVRAELPGSDTNVRAFLHRFLFSSDDVFVPLGNLSYGERARLALARLVARGCNFLLLDEPINHLDIPSRTRFEQALGQFEGAVLAVVHDRYFIESFANEIWEVRGKSIQVL